MARDEDRRPVRPLTQRIAPIIKTFLRDRGITQTALGEELERDQSYISERASGKRPFTTDELDAIAKLAGVAPRTLLEHIAGKLPVPDNVTLLRPDVGAAQEDDDESPLGAVARPRDVEPTEEQ